jgi:hypothetical protein
MTVTVKSFVAVAVVAEEVAVVMEKKFQMMPIMNL